MRNGADHDVNMDDAMLDSEALMVEFLRLIASDPEIARVPIMVDSSKWDVLWAGLKNIAGKSPTLSASKKAKQILLKKRAWLKPWVPPL